MNLKRRYSSFYHSWHRFVRLVAKSALSILLVAVFVVPMVALETSLTYSTVALLLLVPVGMSAIILGLASGITAAVSAFLTLNYFFTQPRFTLVVAHPQDLLALAVFLVVAVSISQLVGRTQASLIEARLRERDVIHLYELMSTLAGHRNQDAIARTAISRIHEVFQPYALEVVIQPHSQARPLIYDDHDGTSPSLDSPPDEVIALMTPRALLGELHLWHSHVQTPAEERLLNTFASQIALALERVMLAQVETRAKVLEESDQLKSALLSSVSHELRTPLATIKAAATSLRSGNVGWNTAARQELIEAIDEESDHLNRLVGNLLDMSRIESGAMKPKLLWNILADVLEGTIARMRHVIKHHRVVVDMSDDLPLVPIDHMQIDQVFTNLISNALKYAPTGSTVRFSANVSSGEELLVEAFNEGPPVPAEDIDRIFDKFYRVTAADRVTGTGLGLSICKGIIEAHGGRIWAENKPGGLSFYFTLPLMLDGRQVPMLPAEVD